MSLTPLYPLQFRPILRRYVWGGRRLETALGRSLPPGDDYAESWEVCDRGTDQSVVAAGPLAGVTLDTLVREHGEELLGRHHPQPRFPLLLKLLDAQRVLSVQVHPDDRRAALLNPPDLGKTEAWLVLDAQPGSVIYAGLKRGFDRAALEREVLRGTCELCLHRFEPKVGDCVFIPAGAVHALGAGIVIAEIQQSSDVTYRLFDWNRVGVDGRPRPLHIEAALEAIDYSLGPIQPVAARPTEQSHIAQLVACDKFILERWQFSGSVSLPDDDRCRLIVVLEGSCVVQVANIEQTYQRGDTLLVPASCRGEIIASPAVTLLSAHLP